MGSWPQLHREPDLGGTQGSLLPSKKELEARAPLVGTPVSSWCPCCFFLYPLPQHLRNLLACDSLLACSHHKEECQRSLSPSDSMCRYLFVHLLAHVSINHAVSVFYK